MPIPDDNPKTARRAALGNMIMPAGVLVLAATARASTEAATWFGIRGPHCPLGAVLGECACPGCGLTRSTAMVVQGRFGEALELNVGGFVVAGLSAAALVLHADVLRRGRVLFGHLRLRETGRWVFVAGVLFAWLARACSWFSL
ncbi:MAG: DUF2752 domain-containing protein [bacterium]|nr:DUF2752 domain-containing protein [bacterium]